MSNEDPLRAHQDALETLSVSGVRAEELRKQASILGVQVAGLGASVESLSESMTHLSKRQRASERNTIILALSLGLDLVLTAVIVFFGLNLQHVADCQSLQSSFVQAYLAARTGASADERLAQRRAFDVMLNPNSTNEDRQKVNQDLQYQSLVADAQRNASPLPKSTCT